MLGIEREDHDPLEAAQAERAVGEGHLLAPRGEQRGDEPLAVRHAAGDDALQQHLEILEETRLPLLYPHDRERMERMDVRDAGAPNAPRDRLRDVTGEF